MVGRVEGGDVRWQPHGRFSNDSDRQVVIDAAHLGGETEATALAIFTGIQESEQKLVSSHDEACGTYNTYAVDTKSSCSNSHFLCGAGAVGA